jgi:hypothetical protein
MFFSSGQAVMLNLINYTMRNHFFLIYHIPLAFSRGSGIFHCLPCVRKCFRTAGLLFPIPIAEEADTISEAGLSA